MVKESKKSAVEKETKKIVKKEEIKPTKVETKKVAIKQEKTAKTVNKKPKTEKVETNNVSEQEMKDKNLQELKKEVDKSFKKKYTNKKKIIGVTLGAIGLAAIGTTTPIAIYNANKEISVLVQSVNATADIHKFTVKKGTKIKNLKVLELVGYEFLGYFKDEACTKRFKSTDELKKNTTIYASYKKSNMDVVVAGKTIRFPLNAYNTIGEAIKDIELFEYKTDGAVYIDEACTQEVNIDEKMLGITLYTKTATVDKLNFIWDAATGKWSVEQKDYNVAGELVIPARYKNEFMDGEVATIKTGSFSFLSKVTKITISSNVAKIEENIFYGCDILTSLYVVSGNKNYHSNGNCIIEIASRTLIVGCKSSIIPTDGSVIKIGEKAFYGCNGLTSITIPNSVTEIGNYAFSATALTEITIPSSVKTIGQEVFNCEKLITIKVDKNNKNYYMEGNCLIEKSSKKLLKGFSSSYIPEDVKIIDSAAFYNCLGLVSINIPNSVIKIGDRAFYLCEDLTNVTLENNLLTIEDSAFCSTGLTEVIIPNSVVTIGDSAFRQCKDLINVTLGNNLLTIGDSAFSSTGLTEIIIPNSVTTIKNQAFCYCTNLTKIRIGENVTSMAENAFSGYYNSSKGRALYIKSQTIVDGLTDYDVYDGLLTYCRLVYIKLNLSITEYFYNNYALELNDEPDYQKYYKKQI